MNIPTEKPRLLYFRAAYDTRLPKFLVNQAEEQVNCLRYSFDVTLITEDGDYRKYCDMYQPDLALFETGVPLQLCRRPSITHVRENRDVPKIGFLNADGFGEGRSGFLSDLNHFDFEAVFAVATTASEYLSGIIDKVFYWPNFVNQEIYRDYRQDKCIPVLMTGNTSALYPWRQQMSRRVSSLYPTMTCPHPGYSGKQTATQFLVGEAYARLINSAQFTATCGTVAKEVVRKHFEIPACNSCLITDKSDGLLAAGFVDMVNCVFSEPDEVQDKLHHLFSNQDVLDQITTAGRQLINDRHTIDRRRQILDWFELRSKLKSGECIIQDNPFSQPRISSLESRPAPYVAHGLLADLLERGDSALFSGQPRKAEASYAACTNYYGLMPEPHLKLALCKLEQGQAGSALAIINKPIQFTIATYGAFDPDPVEWAYLIATLLCQGKLGDAVTRSRQFVGMRHIELDRMRAVVDFLASDGRSSLAEPERATRARVSVHMMPALSFEEWVRQIGSILSACGQVKFSTMLSQVPAQAHVSHDKKRNATTAQSIQADLTAKSHFEKAKRRAALKLALRQRARKVLHGLEKKFGNFLPYAISLKRQDEVFTVVENAVRTSGAQSWVVASETCGDAAFCGIDHSIDERLLMYVRFDHSSSLRNRQWGEKNWTYVEISAHDENIFRTELAAAISELNQKSNQAFPDGVILDAALFQSMGLRQEEIVKFSLGFKNIILFNIDKSANSDVFNEVRQSDDFAMKDFYIGPGQNCAVFERC